MTQRGSWSQNATSVGRCTPNATSTSSATTAELTCSRLAAKPSRPDRASPPRARSFRSVVRALERSNVDLPHLQHRVHDTLVRICGVVAREFLEPLWDDLPGDAELVFAPPAWAWLATVGGEHGPRAIDLFLSVD